jgi:phosphogluconate dehydratase
VRDGDLIRLDAINGELNVLIDATEWAAREPARMPQAQRAANSMGIGRELFAGMRHNVTSAEEGACTWL